MREWFACAAVAVALMPTLAFADELKIDDLVVANTIPAAKGDAMVNAAKGFYQFWNIGDEALLKAAISPDFTDHTLPRGEWRRAGRQTAEAVGALEMGLRFSSRGPSRIIPSQ